MRVDSTRFGPKQAEETELFVAPEGLPGLGGRIFVLVAPHGTEAPFWLQSVQDPAHALLLIDPSRLDPGYAPKPGPAASLFGVQESALLLRVVAWPAEEEGKLYANLFAPVWLSLEARLVAQTPMVGSGHELRVLFDLPSQG